MEFVKKKPIVLLILFHLITKSLASDTESTGDLTITTNNSNSIKKLQLIKSDGTKTKSTRRLNPRKILKHRVRQRHRRRHVTGKKRHLHPVNNLILSSFPEIWSPLVSPTLENALPNGLIGPPPNNIIVNNGLSPIWLEKLNRLDSTREETDLLRRKYRLLLDKMNSRNTEESTTTSTLTTQSMPETVFLEDENPDSSIATTPGLVESLSTSSLEERSDNEILSQTIPSTTFTPSTTPSTIQQQKNQELTTIASPKKIPYAPPYVYYPYYSYVYCPYYINQQINSQTTGITYYPRVYYYPVMTYYYYL